MVDENLLKQLENSLNLYQETQETLDVVVQNAQFAFGEEWLEKLPNAFDDVPMDQNQKALLKDKANHVVHYYGALAAWQEASTYLMDPSSVTRQLLIERIPTLEYWLSLFGKEGNDLLSKVKNLYQTLNQEQEIQSQNIVSEMPLPTETTQQKEQSDEQTNDNQTAQFIQQAENIDQVEQVTTLEPTEPQIIQPIAHEQETVFNPLEQDKNQTIVQILPETFREPEVVKQENNLEEEALVEKNNTSDDVAEIVQEAIIEEISDSTNVATEEKPVWNDTNTAGEMTLDEFVDFDIPTQTKQVPTEEFIDAKEVMQGEIQLVTQNWDLANFLRQKRLFDDANNWLSAWCIRMDNSEKTDYPHYGFIVDLMYDLKDKIQIVLENQLLEELVEQEIPGGQEAMHKLLAAIDKELEDLPDNFKMPTAEKIKLNAREILGAMDNSEEKEFIGPAPDGFELMDDPYAASAEQILSDFEKTEEEAQNQIDKLNVIDENTNKQEKD